MNMYITKLSICDDRLQLYKCVIKSYILYQIFFQLPLGSFLPFFCLHKKQYCFSSNIYLFIIIIFKYFFWYYYYYYCYCYLFYFFYLFIYFFGGGEDFSFNMYFNNSRDAKLIADNSCGSFAEIIVTNRSPLIVMKDLNPAWGSPGSANKTHRQDWKLCERNIQHLNMM